MWKLAFLTAAVFSLSLASSVKRYDYETSETTSTTVPNDDEGNEDIDMVAIMNDCNETFRIEMSYLEQLNENGRFPDEIDKTPKCFVRCVLEKQGVLLDNGFFDTTRAGTLYASADDEEELTKTLVIATVCADRQEKCKCEKSYNFMKCFMENKIEEQKRTLR